MKTKNPPILEENIEPKTLIQIFENIWAYSAA